MTGVEELTGESRDRVENIAVLLLLGAVFRTP